MLAARILILGIALAATASVVAAEPRTWTDLAGRKVEATFVRVHNGDVVLDKDGQMLKAPLARFGAADQQYIRELTKDRPQGDTSPKAAERLPDSPKPINPNSPLAEARAPKESDTSEQKAKAAAADLRRVRDWKDVFGNSVKARFERFLDEQVVLVQGNKPRKVDFAQLSADDQEFLRRAFEAQGKGAEVPQVAAKSDSATGPIASPVGTIPPAGQFGNGVPGISSGFPNFGGLAEQMRSQHEQIRQEHERVRDQLKARSDQMRAQMEAARPKIPPSGFAQAPANPGAVPNTPAAPQGGYGGPFAPAASPAIPGNAISSPSGFTSPSGPPHEPAASPFSMPATAPQSSADPTSPFANAPANPFDGMKAGEMQYQEVIICGSCGKEQRPGFKAGDRCQHCGKIIDEITDESGKVVDRSAKATGREVKFWVWIVITVVGVIGGLIAKLRG